MPGPYSVDLRQRIMKCYHAGYHEIEELCALFGISRRTFDRWRALERETGEVIPLKGRQRGRRGQVDEAGYRTLQEALAKKNPLTLDK